MIDSISAQLYADYKKDDKVINDNLSRVGLESETYKTKNTYMEEKTSYHDNSYTGDTNEYIYNNMNKEDNKVDENSKTDMLEESNANLVNTLGFDVEKILIEDYEDSLVRESKLEEVSRYKVASRNSNDETEKDRLLNNKIDRIKEENDQMYLAQLNSTKDTTINSLYENSFKGEYKKGGNFFKDEDVQKVLGMNGIQSNEQNTWATKMLLDYGMEVDVDSVQRLGDIRSAIDSLEGFANKQKEIEEVVEEKDKEKKIEDKVLLKSGDRPYTSSDIQDIKRELGNVSAEDIKKLLGDGEIPNIKNLKQAMYTNTDKVLNKNNTKHVNKVENETNLTSQGSDNAKLEESIINTDKVENDKVREVKAQIDQIRSKLTVEAAQKISDKMPLESMQLSEIVKEIQSLENSKIEKALERSNLEVSNENKNIIQSVLDAKRAVGENKYQASIIEKNAIDTTTDIEADGEEGNTLEKIHNALKSYESNESIPEKRFKENIDTIASDIHKVLENQGIEVTDDTIKAAKALITNGIEVTPLEIEEVLKTTTKINAFIEDMSPNLAAQLLKEGINPYKSTIDQILDFVKENKFEGIKQSVAETIVALEENGTITQTEKEGLIGLYRIINSVQQNEEEVAGYLYKNNLPLTTQHLQEASKYIDSKKGEHHISRTIDDKFGETDYKLPEDNSRTKITSAHSEATKKSEVIELINNMPIEIVDDTKSKLKNVNALIYPFIKEQFKSQMGKFEGMSTLPQNFIDKLEYIKTVNPEVIENMMKSDIPVTISNIYWYDKINNDPSIYASLLNERGILKEELPKHIREIEEELEQLEASVKEEKDKSVSKGDITTYRKNKELHEMITLQKQFIKEDIVYQIPFLVNGEQRMINLTLDKENSKTGNSENQLKATISYETPSLGMVKAYLTMGDKKLSYKIVGETEEVTNFLQDNKNSLSRLIEGVGYSLIGDNSFETNENTLSNKLLLADKDRDNIRNSDSAFEQTI